MKKSELSFKCILPNDTAKNLMLRAINNISSGALTGVGTFFSFSLTAGQVIGSESSLKCFCNWSEPIMSYEDALKLIESIEPDAPEFDIKLRDEILCRDDDKNTWEIRNYARAAKPYAFMTYGYYYRQIVKFTGNEHFHGTTDTPAGWWECENGKPVWRTK